MSCSFLLLLPPFTSRPRLAQKRIALTFDDVPRIPGTFMTTQGAPTS